MKMKAVALLPGLTMAALLIASAQAQEPPATSGVVAADSAELPFKIPEREKPFWDSAQSFVDAYAKGDSSGIGELFTEDAEFYDEFGERTEGREAIVAMFQGVFDTSPDARVDEIIIERVRMITDTVAMEEGQVFTFENPGEARSQSRYVALHTRGSDNVWRINSLKDFPRQATGRQEQLLQLTWLIGNWVNENNDSVVHTSCEWSEDGNYLLRRFTVRTHDGREMNGVQRVGWDPALKKLRSWTFDSEGGFFNGLWTKNGEQWLLTSAGVTAGGDTVTATSVYDVIDSEMVTWQYRSLIVGGDVQGDMDPVTMVKRPPAPADDSE
ncbi:MAG: YybH family protein [Rubripirellula sp.]